MPVVTESSRGVLREMYRLVVQVDGDETVHDVPPFSSLKQARTHIASAVRKHARGDARCVVLIQRGAVLSDPHLAARQALAGRPAWCEPRGAWKTVAQCDEDTVRRILAQHGLLRDAPGAEAAILNAHDLDGLGLHMTTAPTDAGPDAWGLLAQVHAAASMPARSAPPAGARVRRSVEPPRRPGGRAETQVRARHTRRRMRASGAALLPKGTVRVPKATARPDARRSEALLQRVLADAAARPAATSRYTRNRARLLVTVLIAAVLWLGMTLVALGGNPLTLLAPRSAPPPGVATELPFSVRSEQAAGGPVERAAWHAE